jgi:hypothetical protein
MILASNVLHATPSLKTTLTWVRKLLQPKGRLFFQEPCPGLQSTNLIMGVLPGWWLGENDGRSEQPHVTPERWDTELRNSGFSGLDSVVFDNETACVISVYIESRPLDTGVDDMCITLLHRDGEPSPMVIAVKDALLENKFIVEVRTLQDSLPRNRNIISLVEMEMPLFYTLTPENLAAIQNIADGLGTSSMLWVTGSSQLQCPDPRFGLTLGLARTVRRELGVYFATLEIDSQDEGAVTPILDVLMKVIANEHDGDESPDYEFALQDGTIHVGRYHPFSVQKSLAASKTKSSSAVLSIRTPGDLKSLSWITQDDVGVGYNEIAVHPSCVGLLFRVGLVAVSLMAQNANLISGCDDFHGHHGRNRHI